MNAKPHRGGINESVSDADNGFSEIAKTRRQRFNLGEVLRQQKQKKGVSAIYGKWPGQESDEEIQAALQELG